METLIVLVIAVCVILIVRLSFQAGKNQKSEEQAKKKNFENQFVGTKLVYDVKNKEFFDMPFSQLSTFKPIMDFSVFPDADFIPMIIAAVNLPDQTYSVSVLTRTYEVEVMQTVSRGLCGYNHDLENVFFTAKEPLSEGDVAQIKFVVEGQELKVVHV